MGYLQLPVDSYLAAEIKQCGLEVTLHWLLGCSNPTPNSDIWNWCNIKISLNIQPSKNPLCFGFIPKVLHFTLNPQAMIDMSSYNHPPRHGMSKNVSRCRRWCAIRRAPGSWCSTCLPGRRCQPLKWAECKEKRNWTSCNTGWKQWQGC